MTRVAAAPAAPDSPPVAGPERHGALDVLRGFAVLGIVLPNILAFGQPLEAGFWPALFQSDPGPASDLLWAVQFVLVDGKLRGLFALLFGAGLVLFCERAAARGEGATVLVVRRLAVLALVGAAHAIFLWSGDILWPYGVLGLVALPFLRLPAAKLGVLGLVAGVIGAVLAMAAILPLHLAFSGEGPLAVSLRAAIAQDAVASLAEAAAQTQVIRAGDYTGFVAQNWDRFASDTFGQLAFIGLEIVPLMLLGGALYKGGILTGRARPRTLRRAAAAALVMGALASAAIARWVVDGGIANWEVDVAYAGWGALPQLAMTLGLAVLAAPIAADARGPLARALAGAGRTAFSNYIGTSLVMLALFHGFGLGYFGQWPRWALYLAVVPVWAMMLAWPRWWLARYRMGPLEWAWRCLTYGRRMPFRRV